MQKKLKMNETKSLFALATIFVMCALLACTVSTGNDNKNNSGEKKSSVSSSDKRPNGVRKDRSGTKSGGKSEAEDRGDFIAVYSDIQNENYVAFNEKMKQQKVLESIAEDLNNALALPEDVKLTFKDCGVVNAWWSPQEKTITMCYELMDDAYQTFLQMGKSEQEADDMMFGATTFFFLHELGHCLITMHDIPAVGREEDSVDQLATYVMAERMGEEGTFAAFSGALVFGKWAENSSPSEKSFADEHSLSQQRFYNVICWLYGYDEGKFRGLVENGVLPEERAVRCADEYKKLSSGWQRLVQPYMKS